MRIARAHAYADVELARTWYKVLPRVWRSTIEAAGYEWFILPEDLDVYWIGLAHETWRDVLDSKNLSGFCCRDAWGPWGRPYIYVAGQYGSTALHEAAHELGHAWGEDLDRWYDPLRAVDAYGATNPAEYWATMVESFALAKSEHLVARLNPELYAYLDARWEAAA